MINTHPNCILSSLLLGWAFGLWAAWAMLNWFPFGKADTTMTIAVVGSVMALIVVSLALDWPLDTPSQTSALVFAGLALWSTWLLHRGLSSQGLVLASVAALTGVLTYGLRLTGLSQYENGAMLKRPHVTPWLFWAALLEGLFLLMPITAVLPAAEALGTVVVVGFLWMLASVFGALAGHQAHETSLPEVKVLPPIFGVFLIPWAIGSASLVLGIALGQHTGKWVAWGYVAASLVSAAAAFISRQRILNMALQPVADKAHRLKAPQ